MAKVGSIKQYHSGAAYDVANIYDAKQTSMPGATKVLMHFDSSATTDECGNTWTAVTSKKCLYVPDFNSGIVCKTGNYYIGTQPFTVDWWELLPAYSSTWQGSFDFYNATGSTWTQFCTARNRGNASFCLDYGSRRVINYPGNVFPTVFGVWCHRAITRDSSNVLRCFSNGVKTYETTYSNPIETTGALAVGSALIEPRDGSDIGYGICGYIDEFRVSVGIARWTANFTPPTGNYTKDSYTKVLMHFDSSVTADDCGNTWTTSGSPTLADKPLLSAATKKFGNSSLFLDGNSYLMINGNAPNFFGTDWDFTVDWWEYRTRNSGYGDPIFSLSWTLDSAGESIGCGWIERDNSQKIKMIVNNDRVFVWMGDVLLNQWVHRAFVKSGNHYYGFQNGTLYVDYQSSVRPDYSTSYVMLIGKAYSGGTMFQGYIDEFRISNTARWTANFTPPTSAYSVDGAITVNGNMLIRHNNANCYIPLTTTKANTSIPCLTVRHNNANYYAIK